MSLNKEQLETKVNELSQKKGLGNIKLNNVLAGGVVSDVYDATLVTPDNTNKNIVVKYTKNDIQKSNIFATSDIADSFTDAPATHNLDVKIQGTLKINTPKIIQHFPEGPITLMENFAENGYVLLMSRLLTENVPVKTAEKLGETLATVRLQMENNISTDIFVAVEDSRAQFEERFLELKVLLYNGRMDIFNKIEEDFLTSGGHLVWTDGDQKNFALNEQGEVIFFDLGRSVAVDADFMLPNLLGHLGLFYLAGYLDDIEIFVKECKKSFLQIYKMTHSDYVLDEEKFVNYFTASLLHRGMAMRWIDQRIADKIGEDSLKYASMHFGDLVFDKDNRITTIDKLIDALKKVTKIAQQGGYKRQKIGQ